MSENEVYEAPEAELLGEDNTAELTPSRWARFGAVFIDSIIIALITFAILIPSGLYEFGDEMSLMQTGIMALLGMVVYLVINGYFLATNGQTLGKKLLGTKVVRLNGDKVSFARIVFLRWLVFNIIVNIPIVGGFFGIIDALFIYSHDKRCLHDRLADTKVVFA